MSEDDDRIAGEVMATVMGLTNEDGQSIAERMSVADLWLVIQETVKSVRMMGVGDGIRVPADLNADEARVWIDPKVRAELRAGRKIVAIKEARGLTGLSLKESKDLVERMVDAGEIT